MTGYRFVSVTRDGIKRTGQITAPGEEEARRAVLADGDLLISLTRADQRHWMKLEAGKEPPSRNVAAFAAELAGLLGAGAPMRKALEVQATGTGSTSLLALSVLRQLENGGSLSAALRQEGRSCALLAEFAAAGEAGGGLEPLLLSGARFLESRRSALERARNALAYPAFILVLGALALIILAVYVAPAMAPVVRESGQNSFLLCLAAFGAWCQAHSAAIFLTLAALTAAGFAAARGGRARAMLSRFAWSAPLLGSIVKDLEIAQSTEVLSSLLEAGSSLETALKFAASVSGPHLSRTYLQLSERIRDGHPAGAAFQAETALPLEVRRLAVLGEQSSALAGSLRQAGRLCFDRAMRRIDRLAAMIGPALVIGLGGAIAALMLTVLGTLSAAGDPGL